MPPTRSDEKDLQNFFSNFSNSKMAVQAANSGHVLIADATVEEIFYKHPIQYQQQFAELALHMGISDTASMLYPSDLFFEFIN